MERLGWRLRLTGVKPDTLELMTGIKERRFFEKGTTGVQVRCQRHLLEKRSILLLRAWHMDPSRGLSLMVGCVPNRRESLLHQ